MADLVVLSERDVRRLLPLDELADALTTALIGVSAGAVSVPPRIAAFTPQGLLGAMPGYVEGLGLAAKLVSVYPGNAERGLPSHQALIAVFDEQTGAPLAIVDATYITAIRTAMAAAVAARALATGNPFSMAVIGAGAQGEAHLDAFCHLMRLGEVRVVSRRAARARELAERHPGAVVVPSTAEAVDGADIVCCCTDARQPVVADEWIGSGTHVSSVGTGAELPAGLVARARLVVESRTTATAAPPAGAVELQGRDPASLVEVGDVLAGRAEGRTGPHDVTVYKSTGHAAEDIAAASVVLRRARDLGAGTVVALSG